MKTAIEEKYIPLFKPQYIPAKRDKQAVCIDVEHSVIVDEHGQTYPFSDIHSLNQIIIENGFMPYIDRIIHFPYLQEVAARYKSTTIPATLEQVPTFVNYPCSVAKDGKKRTFRISATQSTSWNVDEPTPEFLHMMNQLYDLCGVGSFTTPGAAAYAIYAHEQVKAYGDDWWKHRHIRPSAACEEFLEAHKDGGRIETPAEYGKIYPEVDVLDRTSAHTDAYRVLPCGKSIGFTGGNEGKFKYYVAMCNITIIETLPYGIVGSKTINGKRHNDLIFPTEQGVYEMALNSRQVEVCRNYGLEVEIIWGYGWTRITEDGNLYTERMQELRNLAPTKELKDAIKLIATAGIGRDGCSRDLYQLVHFNHRRKGDIPMLDDEGAASWWVFRKIRDEQPKSMPHWYDCVVREAMCKVLEIMEIEPDNILMVDTDGVTFIPSENTEKIPEKTPIKVTGNVTRERLRDWKSTANRNADWLEYDGTAWIPGGKHPGISRKESRE